MLKKIAFTLAEILIVIAVIGVVAEMTIPTLIQNAKEKVTITKVKRMHSILSQVYTLASIENGTTQDWVDRSKTNIEQSDIFFNVLSPYMKIAKICGRDGEHCNKMNIGYKTLDGRTHDSIEKDSFSFYLADGSVLAINSTTGQNPTLYCTANSNWCAAINYDINGDSPPNQFGVDTFEIALHFDKVQTIGASEEEFRMLCDKKSEDNANGLGCTAWIIQNENMDYLKCDDLSWDGKKKCSD